MCYHVILWCDTKTTIMKYPITKIIFDRKNRLSGRLVGAMHKSLKV